jgi:hypothetical protein
MLVSDLEGVLLVPKDILKEYLLVIGGGGVEIPQYLTYRAVVGITRFLDLTVLCPPQDIEKLLSLGTN